jgi:hypothetical protein
MKDIWNIKFIKRLISRIYILPECLCLIIFYIIHFIGKVPFEEIAIFFFADNNIAMGSTVIVPIALLGLAVKCYGNMQLPDENKEIFYNWPDYGKFKRTSIVGLVFCSLPVIPTIGFLVFFTKENGYIIGFFYCLLISLSAVSLITMFFAQYTVVFILEKNIGRKK